MMRQPVKIGLAVLGLILVAISAIIGLYYLGTISDTIATIAISGVGATATSLLAVATFWSIKQNEENLQYLQRDQERPAVLDFMSEVLETAISHADLNMSVCREGGRIVGVHNDNPSQCSLRAHNPPTKHRTTNTVWRYFEEEQEELYNSCEVWHDLYYELEEHTEALVEELSEEPLGSSPFDEHYRMIEGLCNGSEYSSIDDVDSSETSLYYRSLYNDHADSLHAFWRSKRDLWIHSKQLHNQAVGLKEELKLYYGISNADVENHNQ